MCESQNTIIANVVSDVERLDFLPEYMPRFFIQFESALYWWMERLSTNYNGAYWEYVKLSNGSGYLYPVSDENYQIDVFGNHFSESVQPETAGIIATLFTLCNVSHVAGGSIQEKAVSHYNSLLEYVAQREDAGIIYRAID